MGKVIDAILAYIEGQVGKAQYSKTRRMDEGYYDCSSIVYRAYKAAGITLSCEHSTSTYEVYAKEFQLLWPSRYEDIGKKYAPTNILQQLGVSGGEHVFYCMDSNTTRANKITHVSTVCKGGKKIVHARNTDVDVCYNDITYGNTRICAVVRYKEDANIQPQNGDDEIMFKRGDKTPNVGLLQQIYKKLGIDIGTTGPAGDGVDNSFGPIMESRTKEFQQSKGLSPTGIVDAMTMFALLITLNSIAGDAGKISELQGVINALNAKITAARAALA